MGNFESKRVLIFGIGLVLVGCGGSDGATDTSQTPPPAATAKTTVGQITGFGSIYVNGVEYDTTGAIYDVDDAAETSDTALAVGMVVKVQGSVSADGRTGQAQSVSYDDDVEGVVENLVPDPSDQNIKTFEILGITVLADANSTNFEAEDDPAFSFDTIMDGDNVEVSGEFSNDVLLASYVEKQDAADNDFEARGFVTQYNGSDQFVLVQNNDATLDVTVASGAVVSPSGIMDGQYVEVEGTIPDPVNAPGSLLANKVELEDDDRIDDDDIDEVEIKGTLDYDIDTESWSVMDVALEFNDATEYSPESLADAIADQSADGRYVEVEGTYENDVLVVREIELEEDDLELNGNVEAIAATGARDGTLTLSFGAAIGTVDVVVTPDTMFLDDEATNHFDLNNVMTGDKIEIDARIGDNGTIYASTLHIEDDPGNEIEGPLEAIDEVSATVVGIEFGIDAGTMFDNGMPVVGDDVEIEDHDEDGIADLVSLDD
ncbi:MAG: DUF5666 domain-containing protein [Woeseiaceae bacterium]|nr:DUF5666 domain-containing protein [Woeseiaceae bacterium]